MAWGRRFEDWEEENERRKSEEREREREREEREVRRRERDCRICDTVEDIYDRFRDRWR